MITAVLAAMCLMIVAGALIYTGDLPMTQSADAPAGLRESDHKRASAGPVADYNSLIGRWTRPDGGYVIDIRKIAADGTMEAHYYNPRPIQVSRAEASRVGATTRVFIELRDVGYPGATYNLVYKPQENVLAGVYFQPAVAQSFNVVFLRMQ